LKTYRTNVSPRPPLHALKNMQEQLTKFWAEQMQEVRDRGSERERRDCMRCAYTTKSKQIVV